MAGIRLRVESRRREKASSAVLEILLIASRSSVRASMPEEARDGISRWLVPVEAVLIALRFGK